MNVWILKDAEPLPLQQGQRPLRSGLLAQELGARGHKVLWWSSTFSHHLKKFIFEQDTRVELMPNVTLLALNAGRYQRNVSFARLRHHRRLGQRFSQLAVTEQSPDVIIAALPIIDFPFQAARYASAKGVTLIVDVRDPWPDVFSEKAPTLLRHLVRILTLKERQRAAHSFKSASAVTAVSNGFLRWALRLTGRAQSVQDRVFYLGHSGFNGAIRNGDLPAELSIRLKGKLVFTFVGSFGHSYELELVAKAARHFHSYRPEVAFVLVGEGHQRSSLYQRYGQLSNLTLTGWLDSTAIGAVLARSHIGLVPCRSLPDTVPNKPFEYLAAGLPLLSSLEGEMAEIIRIHRLGFSYPAGDLKCFIRLVDSICRERTTLNHWSANAKRAFAEEFAASRIYPSFASHVEAIHESSCVSVSETAVTA